MKFPVKVEHRGHRAKIYAPGASFHYYRVVWRVAGQRKVRTFTAYSPAKEFAETTVRDLAKGSQVPALSVREAADALAVRDILRDLAHELNRRPDGTVEEGRTMNVVEAVRAYADAIRRLGGHSLSDAVTGFLATARNLTRKPLADAVEDYLKSLAPLTKAPAGSRPELSRKHVYQLGGLLRRFAASFKGTAVCDLDRPHVDTFMASLQDFSPKTRNHFRSAISNFADWARRKDFLPADHRLADADGLQKEPAIPAKKEIYTPEDFRKLLEAADSALRPLIAIGGLAGVRTEELMRLDWPAVWSTTGHIEISAAVVKGGTKERNVEIVPALAKWLEAYRGHTTGPLWQGGETTLHPALRELCALAGVAKEFNALRHSFCSYHYALHNNANYTSTQAGNNPANLLKHYRKRTTAETARRWFDTVPALEAATAAPISA